MNVSGSVNELSGQVGLETKATSQKHIRCMERRLVRKTAFRTLTVDPP